MNVCEEACSLMCGERQKDYGPPAEDWGRAAKMISGLLAKKLKADLTASDVGKLMVCIKLSRESNKHTRDNLVDVCGYALGVSQIEGDE